MLKGSHATRIDLLLVFTSIIFVSLWIVGSEIEWSRFQVMIFLFKKILKFRSLDLRFSHLQRDKHAQNLLSVTHSSQFRSTEGKMGNETESEGPISKSERDQDEHTFPNLGFKRNFP